MGCMNFPELWYLYWKTFVFLEINAAGGILDLYVFFIASFDDPFNNAITPQLFRSVVGAAT